MQILVTDFLNMLTASEWHAHRRESEAQVLPAQSLPVLQELQVEESDARQFQLFAQPTALILRRSFRRRIRTSCGDWRVHSRSF